MTLPKTKFVPVNDVTALLVLFINNPARTFSANRLKCDHGISEPYEALLKLYFEGTIKIFRKQYNYALFSLAVSKPTAIQIYFKLNTDTHAETTAQP